MKKHVSPIIAFLILTLLLSAGNASFDADSILGMSGKPDTAIIYHEELSQDDIVYAAPFSELRTLRQLITKTVGDRTTAHSGLQKFNQAIHLLPFGQNRGSNLFRISICKGYNIEVTSNFVILCYIHSQDGQKA